MNSCSRLSSTTHLGGIDHVFLHDNTIALGVDAFDGFFVQGDQGNVRIEHNDISGAALNTGITVTDSRGTRTQHDGFFDFEPGRADVWLQSTTSDCQVIEPEATVLDEGLNNEVKAKIVLTTP